VALTKANPCHLNQLFLKAVDGWETIGALKPQYTPLASDFLPALPNAALSHVRSQRP